MRISDWSSDVCSSDLAVISLGGMCLTRSVRAGGAALDQAITDHLHFRHKILIGRQSAERIKKDYAALHAEAPSGDGLIEVRGRSLVSRSEERRVGKECVSTCRSRWWQYH